MLNKKLGFEAADGWELDPSLKKYPTGRRIDESDVLDGWVPEEEVIGPQTRVIAFGSCFAAHFLEFLLKFHYNGADQPGVLDQSWLTISVTFENVLVVLQQFQWAFGQVTPAANTWVMKDKTIYDATEERRLHLRAAFENSDVFLVTLGLSEVWFHKESGQPMWRGIPSMTLESDQHGCRRLTVSETVAALRELDRLACEFLPEKRFILTLSPIPLGSTFRKQSAVTANQASKAVIRAALDEFITDPGVRERGRFYYFPSYELVFHLFDHPFAHDNRHLRLEVISTVMEIFRRSYTTIEPERSVSSQYSDNMQAQISTLTDQLMEKERVIRELDLAARERLALVERLVGELKSRQQPPDGQA